MAEPSKHPPERLNKRFIESLQPEAKPYTVRDTGVPGLMVYVGGRAKTFKVQRDMRVNGVVKTLKHTVGTFPTMTVDQARTAANKWIESVKTGVNPNKPEPVAPAPVVWTVERAFDAYTQDRSKRAGSERTCVALHAQWQAAGVLVAV